MPVCSMSLFMCCARFMFQPFILLALLVVFVTTVFSGSGETPSSETNPGKPDNLGKITHLGQVMKNHVHLPRPHLRGEHKKGEQDGEPNK